ncbi:MAG: hypothetical protein IT576_15640, partial [Verrucomicrobiales bacterium]|nr:hypothetical protein [Verrucomicrobiales bacterium]
RILESEGDGSDEKQADAKDATTDQPKKALPVDKGSLFQMQAPVTTLLKTRSTGHRQHGDQALAHLVVKAKNLRGITIIRADFVYPKGEQPLTWHLTRNQMQDMATIKFTGGDEKAMDKPLPDISTEEWNWYGTSTSREVTNVWADAATIPERKGKADLQREALSKALTPSDFDLKSIASGAKILSKPPPHKPNAPEVLTEAWRALRDTIFPQEKAGTNPPSPVIR